MMARLLSTLLVLSATCAMLGCGAQAARIDPGPDCTAGAGYDLSRTFMDASKVVPAGSTPSGFNFGDTTPGATLSWQTEAVDPSTTCGDMQVLDIQSAGHNDYGSSFFLLLGAFNATGAEGISFWARSPVVASSKTVTLEISDANTDSGGGICVDTTTTTSTDMGINTPTVVSGSNATNLPNYVPPADACGNYFLSPFQFTNEWTLYLLPFEQFAQLAQPSRSPNGIDTAALYEFGFQIPKESQFDLWIDHIGVYQPTSADAGP